MSIATIAPGHDLATPAAQSWWRLVEDGCPTTGIRSARRSRDEQRALFLARYRPARTPTEVGPYRDARKYLGVRYVRISAEGSVAVPGSPQANHEDGLALDLFGDTLAWVREHGHRYGWIKDLVDGEDWHVEYVAALDTRTPSALLERITSKEDPEMIVIRRKVGTSYQYRLVTGTKTVPQTRAAVVALKKAGVKVVPLASGDYLRIYKSLK